MEVKMFNPESREVVLRLPKEINRFFKEQLRFLRENGQKEPMRVFIEGLIFLFQDILKISQNNMMSMPIQGSLTGNDFTTVNLEKFLNDFAALSSEEEYLLDIPSDFWPILDEACRCTECTSYEEVIFCGLCSFKVFLGVINDRSNIFVRFVEHGEIKEELYNVPLLSLYKAHVYH